MPQYHRLVESDVRNGDLILEQLSEDGTPVIRFIRAQVRGELVVVRLINPDVPAGDVRAKTLVDRAILQDDILKRIRLWDAHRNVARVYGWGDGSVRQRFTVLISGSRPICDTRSPAGVDGVDYFMQTASKLLGAARHLEGNDIIWHPENVSSVFVDERGEPCIGLANDFRLGVSVKSKEDSTALYSKQLVAIRWIADRFAQFETVDSNEEILGFAKLQDERMVQLLTSAGVTVRMSRLRLPKFGIERIFGRGPAIEHLHKAFAAATYCNCPLSKAPAGDILFLMVPKYHYATKAKYFASGRDYGTDILLIVTLEDDGTALHFQKFELEIDNRDTRAQARTMFGIRLTIFGDERDYETMRYVPALIPPSSQQLVLPRTQ